MRFANLKPILRIIYALLAVLYPFGMYFGIHHFEPKILSLLLVCMAFFYLLSSSAKNPMEKWQKGAVALILGGLALLMQLFNNVVFVKIYPASMSFFFFCIFTYTLFSPPTMIEKFARIKHPNLEPHVISYTRNVTIIWSVFLFINSCILLYTAFYTSVEIWTLYSGFICYCLMGVLFVGEYIIRQFVIRKHEA